MRKLILLGLLALPLAACGGEDDGDKKVSVLGNEMTCDELSIITEEFDRQSKLPESQRDEELKSELGLRMAKTMLDAAEENC